MRQFLLTSLIVFAFVGAAGVAPVAHAATALGDKCTDTQPCTGNNQTCDSSPEGICVATTALGTSGATGAAAASTETLAGGLPKDPTGSEGFGQIMIWIMSLFAWLVGVAAVLLDNVVYYTVVKMGSYVNSLSAVGVTWRILRDVGNIMLIFGFLSVGITTILNVEWYGVSKKMLPMMFVAAVFLNFSLFMAEAMVDTGNLFATQFYQQINGGQPAGAKSFDPGFSIRVANEGISNKIMGQLGLQTIYGEVTNSNRAKDILKAGNSLIIGFMSIILFIVTAFVLFSLAFVLIARFVALLFLIIASPLGFAALAMPGFANIQKKWWTNIFEQTMVAPVLLLMLYIALTIITDEQFLTGFDGAKNGPQWLGWINNGNMSGFGSMILSFLVAMGLLLAVVVYAKRWSAFGGDWASRMGARLSFGVTAFGLRSTAGWGLQGASQAIRRSRLLGGTKTGRVLAGTFDRGAKGSFDLRGTGVLKTIPFGSQIDAGAAQQGGYRARQEASIKGHQDYIKSVGAAIDEGNATEKAKEQFAAMQAERTAAQNAINAAQAEHDRQKAETERLAAIDKNNRDRGIFNQKDSNAAKEAQKKLAESKNNLAAANEKLATATEKITNKAGKEKTLEDIEKEVLGGQKKQAQLAYAENISGSLPGWAMFGPGGAPAAKKIIRDAKKSPDQQLLENLKKAIEFGEKTTEPKKEEAKPEAPKP